MSSKVLVIGGTGKVGGRLVKRLVEAEQQTRSASRSGKAPVGAEGIVFDWFDVDGHAAALSGVDCVYMIAPIGSSNPIEVMEPFIERAIAEGTRRFVLQSSSLIGEGGPAMGAVHALLHQRAPEWAVLRPSWFMENFTIDAHLESIKSDDALYSATDDGVVPFIAVADIAEVALNVLMQDEPVNDGLILSGPEALSYVEVAHIIGEARGKPVRHIRLIAEELAKRLEGFGIPQEFATMLAGLDRAIAAGADARTTPTVFEMTGRAPLTFADFAVAHAAVWLDTQ